MARLWGVDPGDIGFVGNVAEGVSIVAESIDWRDGDSIAIDAHEYPSVVGPIAMRRNPAVALHQARGTEPDRLSACVDGSTRIIAASYVSYLTGERTDLTAPARPGRSCRRVAPGGFHPGLRLPADRGLHRRLRLLRLLQMDARYHRRRRRLLEPHPPTGLDAHVGRLVFLRPRLPRLRHNPGAETRCDAVHPRQPGALSDLRPEQRVVVSVPVRHARRPTPRPDADGGAVGRSLPRLRSRS